MQLIMWMFHGLQIPMMKGRDAVLYCTSKTLCSALGLTTGQLRIVHLRHQDRLNPVSVTNCNANGQASEVLSFLKMHKAEFGIERLRGDMLLWPLDEALGVAFHVHTDVAWEFHRAAIQLIKQNATTFPISIEDYERIVQQNETLLSRVGRLEEIILQSKPALDGAASAIGAALSAQRGTKTLRLVH